MIAYLAYLVQTGVVQEAYLNFLPVGHTHEDIDQVFSRVSVYTRRHNAPCPASLRECIRKSFKKYGREPIVVAWDKVANISGYFKRFTHANMSKDITQYYQLKVTLARSGDIAGWPILSARTWPGAAEDDRDDYWRGLLPNTAYTLIFKELPSLLEDRLAVPTQAQPHHIGNQTGTPQRLAYENSLLKLSEDVERLFTLFPVVFKAENIQSMRELVTALGSNLDPDAPVSSVWSEEDMDFLYGEGQYV